MIKKYINFILYIFIGFCLLFSKTPSDDMSFPIHEPYYISSEYGYRNLSTYHMHNGIDIPKPKDTPIYALSDGIVTNIGFSNSYGNYIIISYHNSYKSLYGHLSDKYNVLLGDSVSSSTVVGYVGPKYLSSGKLNGFTTGPHLHFTLYDKSGNTINPLSIKFK